MVSRLRPAVLPGLGASAPVSNVSATEWNQNKLDVIEAATNAMMANSRVFDVRAYGDIGTSDDSATFIAALADIEANGGGVLTGPKGFYTFLTGINHPPNVAIDFPLGTVFDMTGVTTFVSDHVWYGQGALTPMPAISSAISKDARTITFASSPSVGPGDTILLSSSVDFSFSLERASYRKGEAVTVVAVSGNSVTTAEALDDSYLADGSVTASAMEDATFIARGIHVLLPNGRRGLGFDKATRVDLDITLEGGNWTALSLWRSVNITLNRPRHFSASPTDGAGINYSVGIFNCQNITINDPDVQVSRHGITTGGTDYLDGGGIVNRNIVINGGKVSSSLDHASGYGMDFHGNTEYAWLRGVQMPKGLHVAGDHIYVDKHCTVESAPNGCAVEISNNIGWDIVIEANIRATRALPTTGLVYIALQPACVRVGNELSISGKVDIGTYRAPSGASLPVSIVNNSPSAGAVRLDGKFTAAGVSVGDNILVWSRFGTGTTPMQRVVLGGEWASVNCTISGTNEINLFRARSVNAPGIGFNMTAPKIVVDSPYVRNSGTENIRCNGGDNTKATGEVIVITPISLDANNAGAAATGNGGINIINTKDAVLINPTFGDTRTTPKQIRSYAVTSVGTLRRTPVAILGTVATAAESPDTTVNI